MTAGRTSIIDALTLTRSGGEKRGLLWIFMVLLLVVFFAIVLIAVISGVSVYRSVANMQSDSSDNRLGLGLVANCVRSNDAQNTIAVGPGPEGRALVFVENLETGSFETRIYLADGMIVQEYALASAPYTPSKANSLAASEVFDFTYANGLLTIYTDQGVTQVALRSSQGGQ